ncbi:endoplasmic reticulum metallopeptidase 1-like [Daktulosphaira vitifoliae]|uniref:endoplasmic reticulum metallopeptidase 1-like n=1 Tax=Daktulosphaira vitifoliae TaxID=58002 RepID=UPI0021A9E1C2|nr:endoplasmic reticulum metallopeptidase 1-like [Daktulosphaira vitifoliae]
MYDIGPRPVGSYENENLTYNLLQSEVENIIQSRENLNNISFLNQKVSGSFQISFTKWNYTYSYIDLKNIVVKLSPKNNIEEAVLINCHYDSVPAGPGVSDNGVNCAVLIELLRVLAKSSELQRPIIFLFNGGEEVGLRASHGFITQHLWSNSLRFVINLDSCGAGGKEIMFQTTTMNSYLVELYAKAVPNPYGLVIGEEIFQSGLIPSDTDFRIFRDFGNLSGLDFAHYKNGYVYHTKFDDLNQIEPAVLQNTGNNLLKLVKIFSSHNVSSKIKTKYVFFDIFGLYMFSYTELSGVLVNFSISLLSFFSIFLSFGNITKGMNRKHYSLHFLLSIFVPMVMIILSTLLSGLMAYILDEFNSSMSWYSNKINLSIYYAISSLTLLSIPALFTKNHTRKSTDWSISFFNGIQFFWTMLLFISTMVGIRSSYLSMIVVLFPAVTNCILGIMNIQKKPITWIAFYATSLLLPITYIFYLMQIFLSLFIPITGRFGPNVNPDYIISFVISLSTYATIGYLSPLIILVKKPSAVLYWLCGIILLSMGAILSPFGFPYSDGLIVPKNERFDIIYTQRTFSSFNKDTRLKDYGYLIINWDRHSPYTISKYVKKMRDAKDIECSKELLCGLPLADKLSMSSSWIPTNKDALSMSHLETNTTVILNDKSGYNRRMEFHVSGPERINIILSPYPGVKLTLWSFSNTPTVTTKWDNNDVYIIKHVSGNKNKTLNFWLELESNYGFNEQTLNVTIAYNWVIRKDIVLDNEFKQFVDSFPSWAHVNYAVAKVDAFTY